MSRNKKIPSSSIPIPESGYEAIVEEFQCPGCVCGSDTKCGKYSPDQVDHHCTSHVLGTSLMGGGFPLTHIALGLPKGFCRPGPMLEFNNGRNELRDANQMSIRLWQVEDVVSNQDNQPIATKVGGKMCWDRFNIPVWAIVQNGVLFVRTYLPRINRYFVDVIKGGTMDMVPKMQVPIDVGEFYDMID